MDQWTEVEMMVTVKAYPQLSKKSGEVVCVAGVRTDLEKPEWIRIYPVPFRDLPLSDRFEKYDIVKLRVAKSTDTRRESYKPDLASLRVVEKISTGADRKWSRRTQILGSLRADQSMCAILKAQDGPRVDAPSLALIQPREIVEVGVVPNDQFSAEKKRLAEMASAVDLFGNSKSTLEPAPYQVKYRYLCSDKSCKSHDQSLIDWELGAAGRKWSTQYTPSEISERIRKKFYGQLCAGDRDTHFYIGNQHQRPKGFLILGVYWPPIDSSGQDSLF